MFGRCGSHRVPAHGARPGCGGRCRGGNVHYGFLGAFTVPGLLPVEIAADHTGTTSARYGFCCGYYATGYRVIVKIDRETGEPTSWSDWYRTAFAEVRRARG